MALRKRKKIIVRGSIKKSTNNYIPASYINEINASNKHLQPLNKMDYDDLKRFAQYYGYYYDKKAETIHVNGVKHNIYRIKNKLYAKSTTNCIQLNKVFKLTKAIRAAGVDKDFKKIIG